jgi:hypothetical protein
MNALGINPTSNLKECRLNKGYFSQSDLNVNIKVRSTIHAYKGWK